MLPLGRLVAHVGPQPTGACVLPRPGSSTGTGVSSACSFSAARGGAGKSDSRVSGGSALMGDVVAEEREHETIPQEPFSKIQGQGGVGRDEGERPWSSWLSSLTSIRTRSRSGERSCWSEPRRCSRRGGQARCRGRLKELHAKIGQQALEIDFLAGALGRIGDRAQSDDQRDARAADRARRSCWICRARRCTTRR